MDCKEVQKRYIPFIDDKLSVKDLDEFLHHMNTCQDCREEYHIYYTMIMGIRYLEDDSDKKGNWVNSQEKLQYAREYLRKYRFLKMLKYIVFVGIIVGILLVI